ncbi:MAG: hypothetical protein B7Z60_03685 [Ferrovum sp. 37-45-19]|uniref:hypothetical protein n=1 Tax=Ferrovum sp. JA12 TaxID=1356299 RepID=UPI0007030F18|nr:hypothetical protein [Ferrovum sp. JA12]OYV78665.1 MAG: hypothetical protein B7Z65_09395 [Ferrovum sp. 21-44-67]OYV94905.1 MAG: hypothetical protein B7Z60_03685 [Ferrovum sp. 37-45-19]HQT82331.1 hypothetical protein [Ferrovaceae bacterium]HQU06834.1 hypothetical protein [Ferrovaceae bacterium]
MSIRLSGREPVELAIPYQILYESLTAWIRLLGKKIPRDIRLFLTPSVKGKPKRQSVVADGKLINGQVDKALTRRNTVVQGKQQKQTFLFGVKGSVVRD